MSALKKANVARKRLGELLIEARIITQEQLKKALALSMDMNRRIGDVLLEQGLVTPQQLALFTSIQLSVPYIDLKKYEISTEAVEQLPELVARRYNVIPINTTDHTITLAMEDPGNIHTIENIETVTKKRVEPVLALSVDVLEAIDRNYRSGGEIEKQLAHLPTKSSLTAESDTRFSADAIAQAPVVRAIDLLIRQAVRDRCSDIHIEPQEDILRIRYRIDGILHETLSLPLGVHPPLLSRLKIMAGLNIAERRRPQDGQITFQLGDKEVDIRVATSNTIRGEMAVLRILDKSFAFLDLPEIGFLPESLERYMHMLKTPFGMVLISGPTGSGKTTTLYASINRLDNVGKNTITIEDPVEYHFSDINQMQVNPQANVTFASGLRACMRLDPDVILVGEIRDGETSQIAIQAALTGHLVMSSVHANDTAGVIFRLVDLGVEPFLVASALIGIVAQRMVRRVCTQCGRLVPGSDEDKASYFDEMHEKKDEFLYGSGCNFCANTGYLGRTAIFEVMSVSETIRRMIINESSADEIRAQAYQEGMISLLRDGMLKVKSGLTTPYEIQRNVYSM